MKQLVMLAICSSFFGCAYEEARPEEPGDAAVGGAEARTCASSADGEGDKPCVSDDRDSALESDLAPGIESRAEGEDDDHWYTPIWPFPWPGHHGHKRGGPGDKPYRKQCIPQMGVQECLECCYYNHDHVDGWECRRKRKGSRAAARCWKEAIQKLADCQVHDCKRHSPDPIITTMVQPCTQ